MVKGRITLSVERMDGKGDCMNCPVSVWNHDLNGTVCRCPLVNEQYWWEKCPMEFVEVKDDGQ